MRPLGGLPSANGRTRTQSRLAVGLPMKQPTKFEPPINLKISTVLGIKIPQSILVRVDRLIE